MWGGKVWAGMMGGEDGEGRRGLRVLEVVGDERNMA